VCGLCSAAELLLGLGSSIKRIKFILAVHLPTGRQVWNSSFELQVRGMPVALGPSAVPTDKGPSSVISFGLYNSARHYHSVRVPSTGETCRLSILHRGGATHDDEVPGCSRSFWDMSLALVEFPEDGCNLVLC
jgi:hypothetical protein